MGSIAIYLTLYVFGLMLYVAMAKYLEMKAPKIASRVKSHLVFKFVLSLGLESYLVMIISSTMTMANPCLTTGGEKTSLILAYVTLGVWAVFIPLAIIWVSV